ncbi:MAG TPA: phosphodiesterase [Chromatiales bacterium]|nr:phosphodiesterase [Chromatiales bacterium]
MPRLLPLFSLVALGLAGTAGAQTLNLPAPAPAEGSAMPVEAPAAPVESVPAAVPGSAVSVRMPGRGMTMEQVEAKFGSPREKHTEVGDPPIIRWDYPDFSVYFEYQYVIDAVASRYTR